MSPTVGLTPFAALVLGIIQGITEFLPISSSAHLALAHHFFGWQAATPEADLVFDVALHFGTLVALVIYFFQDWVGFIKRGDKLIGYVIVACIPGGIVGALLEKKAEDAFRSPLHIALLIALLGLVMAAAERFSKREREIEKMTWSDALWIGVMQALAIMPGVSRAGITMTTGLFRGLTREAAARFSFLLATPIMLGATLWEARHLLSGSTTLAAGPVLIGVLASAVTGFAAISFLLRFLRQHSFYPFVIYRLVLAAVIVLSVYLMPWA